MSSSTSRSKNEKIGTPATPYKLQRNDVLHSSTTHYLVMDLIGQGCFGKVAKCRDLMTGNQVAVKIHKNKKNVSEVIEKEKQMLQAIRSLDPDKNNIVNFMEDFKFNNLSCLAFEMLDRSLWDLIEERDCNPLSLNELRPVIQQLMVALDALKSIGIIHTDIKPDNIMLVNHKDQPFKIKLIDFGLARRTSEVPLGTIIQPSSFRAPEVTLGLPLTEAVDMWGVGCIMAFLYFAREIFPRKCSYNWIRCIVNLLGQPADHFITTGVYTWAYFKLNDDPHSPVWRLKTLDEFKETTGIQAQSMITLCDFVENLDEAVQTYPDKQSDIEYADRMAFLSLLKATLDLDPERRITPREALKHPFLSMVHLENKTDISSYSYDALQFMNCLGLKPESEDSRRDTEMDSSEKTDDDHILTGKTCFDNPCFADEDDVKPVSSYSRFLPNFSDGHNTRTTDPTEPSLHFDEGCLEKRPSSPVLFCGEDLPQADHIINEEKLTNELQAEKNKTKLLQEELEQLRISYQLLVARYENDVPKIREQADAAQRDLDNEILQKKHLQSDFDKATAALQDEKEKNKTLQDELDKTTEVNLRYQTEVTDVRQQADTLRSDLKRCLEQNKLLQTAYEDLQEAHKVNQEILSADAVQRDLDNEILQKKHLQSDFDKATAALQDEKEKNKILQGELDRMTEVNLRYQTEVTDVRQQADTLRSDLKRCLEQNKLLQTAYEDLQEAHKVNQEILSAELKNKNKTVEQDMDKICISHCEISQRDETDDLHQKMEEEITILQKNAFEEEKIFCRELDELKTQFSVQNPLKLKLSTEREAPQKINGHDEDREDKPSKQQEPIPKAEPLEITKEAEEEMPCEQQETISPAPALESQEADEGNLPQRTAEPPSFWKRVRHFLGLRKPKKWKKKKEDRGVK